MAIQLGTLKLQNNDPVIAGSWTSWSFTYSPSFDGLQVGTKLYIGFDNRQRISTPQSTNPQAPNYITASTLHGETLPVEITFVCHGPELVKNKLSEFLFADNYDPLMTSNYTLIVISINKPLLSDENINIILGDTSQGSPGFVAPKSSTKNLTFYGFIGIDGSKAKKIPNLPQVCIEPADIDNGVIAIPSILTEQCNKIGITMFDRYQNPIENKSTQISLVEPKINLGKCSAEWHCDENNPELHCIKAKLSTTSGEKEIRSNYALAPSHSKYKIFWGDIHGHCNISDGGSRSIDEYYSYARDAIMLDFCALSDHSCGCAISNNWEIVCATANKYNDLGKFVTFIASESMAKTPRNYGGHKVHIFPGETAPLLYGDTQRGFEKLFEIDIYKKLLNPNAIICDSLKKLWSELKKNPSLTINHHSWAGASFINQQLEPLYEIHSKWGTSETDDGPTPTLQMGVSARQLLDAGLKLGFVGCSDTHDAKPGGQQKEGGYALHYSSGITAVWAKDLTRKDIYEALRARRCYATTGARLLLKVNVAEHMMGQEFSLEGEPEFEITAGGTCELDRIDIIRNGQIVFTELLFEDTASLVWKDTSVKKGFNYYYVRLRQDDGHIAWTSPFFITVL